MLHRSVSNKRPQTINKSVQSAYGGVVGSWQYSGFIHKVDHWWLMVDLPSHMEIQLSKTLLMSSLRLCHSECDCLHLWTCFTIKHFRYHQGWKVLHRCSPFTVCAPFILFIFLPFYLEPEHHLKCEDHAFLTRQVLFSFEGMQIQLSF